MAQFDVSKVFTAVNADELEPGSKVILADGFGGLKKAIEADEEVITLKEVLDENKMLRFKAPNDVEYALAYLIEPPEEKKLKWTDLKVGDIVSNQTETLMVVGIETRDMLCTDGRTCHVNLGGFWISDDGLEDWEKVEE